MVFSIIIATYNTAKTLENCLKSVLSQDFSDFEILIMDGASQDETLLIANSCNDDRIKIFSEKDTGVYDAMNKGILNASGEWLYFLGADDELYDKNVLSTISQYITTNRCDLVYGDVFLIGAKRFYNGAFSRLKLFQEGNICHQAIFYKRSVFDRIGYYNLDFKINADWDFNLRCFATPNLSIQYINLPIAKYNDLSGLSNLGIRDKFVYLSGELLYSEIAEFRKYSNLISVLKKGKAILLSPLVLLKRIWKKIFGK